MNTTQSGETHAIFWIEGVGVAAVGVFGLFVNMFAIYKLTCGLKNKERHTFHHLLLSLSICDLSHIILTFTCFSLPQLSLSYQKVIYKIMLPFLIPLAQMSLSCSSFTTVVSVFCCFKPELSEKL